MTLLLLIGPLAAVAAADGLRPVWRVGDSWQVRAVYKKPPPVQGWTAPVVWRYTVAAVEPLGGRQCLRVEITPLSDPDQVATTLWIAEENRTLVAVEVRRQRRGRIVRDLLRFDATVPVRTRHTITPYDWPVFPVTAGRAEDFTVKTAISGDLTAVEVVRQKVQMVDAAVDIPIDPPDGPLQHVSCRGKGGRLLFEQYFSDDNGWPLFGRNDDMQYWLVKEP